MSTHHGHPAVATATRGHKAAKHHRSGAERWVTNHFGWEDLIVFFFAVVGFVASVYLYKTGTAPIITSFFLATGVASLVYRFLGGIKAANFKFGALRVGGTLAALVGIAVGVDHSLSVQPLFEPAGRYEWQWAGSGWIGYVEVDQNGTARIDMNRHMSCGGEQKIMKVLQDSGKGKAVASSDKSKLHIIIPVQFVKYDASCKEGGLDAQTVLEGDLDRTAAFKGKIKYKNAYGAPLGDMVLVKGN